MSFAEEWLVRERCDPASYFLSSPVVFWLLAKLAELWPTEACLPLGKVWEIPGGNKRRRSAVGTFPAPQAPEPAEGLDGVERTHRIRRTAAKKRRRHNRTGHGGALRRRDRAQQPATERSGVDAQRGASPASMPLPWPPGIRPSQSRPGLAARTR
ncbi:hypothetical protein ARUE_232p00990 (plasmid) [Arthrobacter sp. Rue61a]|nr:hypothetical protein ARUE_232p00990 [Arthrobacter sp. Rue61a]